MFKKLALLLSVFTVGVLLAPKSGKETRQDLKTKLDGKVKELKTKATRK
jgi:gas vesicle protein